MLIDRLLRPPDEYASTPLAKLSAEILRDHLLRALLAAHLAQRVIKPSERLPTAPKRSTRVPDDNLTMAVMASWLNPKLDGSSHGQPLGPYGALLVYAITLWRVWRVEHLACCPGFTLLAPPALFKPQLFQLAEGRALRVHLAPSGVRPLRERWESASNSAYREPIAHTEILDGLSLIVMDELHALNWEHVHPWTESGAVRPLSAQAATERRAPRIWLFPLEHGKLEFTLIPPKTGRPWTGGFHMKYDEPMTAENRERLNQELTQIAKRVAQAQEPGPSRDVLVFPELCLDLEGVRYLLAALRETGSRPALVIAGSHHAWGGAPDGAVRALAPVYGAGEDNPLWCHHKRGPFRVTGKEWKAQMNGTPTELHDDAELWEHIEPGMTFTTFDGPGGRIGVLICSDLLEERFPSMRDLVRVALVDLLVIVNYSPKTTPFMRHAEQLNRLGVCAVFLNAAAARPARGTNTPEAGRAVIEPFSALVALPQLTGSSSSSLATWFMWSYDDRRLDVLDHRSGAWTKRPPDPSVNEQDDPVALVVDLNAWLMDPQSVADNDPVMKPLEQAIMAALTGDVSSREARGAELLAAERSALPKIAKSLPTEAKELVKLLFIRQLFEPGATDQHDTLKSLFDYRLARPHRLATPPRADNPNGVKAESSFVVSLTPLGSALARTLAPPKRARRKRL